MYLDEDVAEGLGGALRRIGHDVISTREAGQKRASDVAQLDYAIRTDRTLITHNGSNYRLLQEAWDVWSVEWGTTAMADHPGISGDRTGQRAWRPPWRCRIGFHRRDVPVYRADNAAASTVPLESDYGTEPVRRSTRRLTAIQHRNGSSQRGQALPDAIVQSLPMTRDSGGTTMLHVRPLGMQHTPFAALLPCRPCPPCPMSCPQLRLSYTRVRKPVPASDRAARFAESTVVQIDASPKPTTVLFEAHGERIVLDPHRSGKHRAGVAGHEVPLWELVASVQWNGWNVVQTAADYAIPDAAARAHLAYYRAEPQFVDEFLLLNEDMTTWLDCI